MVTAGKDGTIYLLNANSLGERTIGRRYFRRRWEMTRRYASIGVWGAMATAVDPKMTGHTVIVAGKIYFTTHNSTAYAFGLKK